MLGIDVADELVVMDARVELEIDVEAIVKIVDELVLEARLVAGELDKPEVVVELVIGLVIDELRLEVCTDEDVVDVKTTVAIVELVAMLLVDDAVEIVDAGVDADWQSNPTL